MVLRNELLVVLLYRLESYVHTACCQLPVAQHAKKFVVVGGHFAQVNDHLVEVGAQRLTQAQ